jgi:WD40 repeat protein
LRPDQSRRRDILPTQPVQEVTLQAHNELIRTRGTEWIFVLSFLVMLLISGCGPQLSTTSSPQGATRLSGHSFWVQDVAWSPDGAYIASGSADQSVRIWDVRHGVTRHTLDRYEGAVDVISWSPDGRYIATGSHDPQHTLHVWDAQNWQIAFEVDPAQGAPNAASVTGVDWSPDSKQLGVALSGTTMMGGPVESWVAIYDTSTWQQRSRLPYRGVGYLDWSPDGSKLAFGAFPPDSVMDSLVDVWTLGSDVNDPAVDTKELHVVDLLTSLSWSPDSKLIVVGTANNNAYIFDVTTGKPTQTLRGHTMTIEAVDWSPNGEFVATGGSDTTVKIWHVNENQPLRTYTYPDVVQGVAWAPDGKSLAIACADRGVYIQPVDIQEGNHNDSP